MSYPHDDRPPERIRKIVAALALAGFGVGCASTGEPRIAYSPEAFVVAARARAPQMAHEDLVVPFQVTPEMIARAEHYTSGSMTDFEKADRLMKSLTDPNAFGLSYDAVATSTPDETVAQGHGNCLALTSIFIGLARQIGLTAYYVDASDRINDLRRGEELIVDSGHIAGGVRTERGYTLVDYDGHVSRYRTFRIIDDITALAHFYNNRGFETIFDSQQAGGDVPWEQVMHDFQLATMVSSDFTRAYNNLGVAYTRLGDLEAAEEAYRHAISSDEDGDAAYHNLGNLYMRRGDYSAALTAYDQALARRKRNPYLLYHRGMAQYRLGELSAAEESFKRAIALEQDYIEPRSLLAQVLYQQGKVDEAERVRADVQRILRSRQER